MAQGIACDNHPERAAAVLLTHLANGDTLALCGECWPQFVVDVAGSIAAATAGLADEPGAVEVDAQFELTEPTDESEGAPGSLDAETPAGPISAVSVTGASESEGTPPDDEPRGFQEETQTQEEGTEVSATETASD